MATIGWLYERKSCVTCKKARTFLEPLDVSVKETVDAGKMRFGESEALALLKGVEKLIVAKGKKSVEFDLKKDRPTDEVLLANIMGPTGNLRAPTTKVGKIMMVGFNEEVYRELFGEE